MENNNQSINVSKYGLPFNEPWKKRHDSGMPDWFFTSAQEPFPTNKSAWQGESEALKKGTPMGGAGMSNMKLGTGEDPRGNAQMQAIKNAVGDQSNKIHSLPPVDVLGTARGKPALSLRLDQTVTSPDQLLMQAPMSERVNPQSFAESPPELVSQSPNASPPAGSTGEASLMEKAAMPLMLGAKLAGTIVTESRRGKVIASLDDSIDSVESTMGNIPNETFQAERAMSDSFSEQRRRIGKAGNLQLGNALGKIRDVGQGGLTSGSKKEIMNDIVADYGTRSDLNIASAFDKYEEGLASFGENQRNRRASLNQELKSLKAQLDKERKAQNLAIPNLIADVGIGVVSMGNPMLGMALGGLKDTAISSMA